MLFHLFLNKHFNKNIYQIQKKTFWILILIFNINLHIFLKITFIDLILFENNIYLLKSDTNCALFIIAISLLILIASLFLLLIRRYRFVINYKDFDQLYDYITIARTNFNLKALIKLFNFFTCVPKLLIYFFI